MAEEKLELKDTKYFEEIVRDTDAIVASAKKFNEEYERFWTANVSQLGKILVAHLIVEHYLDAYIPVAFPGISAEAIEKLQFSQKLDVANLHGLLSQWINGIRALNRVRNKLAHNLEESISESDLGELRKPTAIWIKASGQKVDWAEIDVFQEFSRWVAGFINAETNGILRHGGGFGRVAFDKWVTESVRTPRNKTDGPTGA